MKRFLSLVILLFIGTAAFSQSVSFTSPNAESQKMLDSVKYILPEFTAGMVIFKNGEQSNGAINISTIDQKIHFIDPKGEILVITNNDDVSRVFAKGRTFLNSRYGYVELYETIGDIFMGEVRRVGFISEDKVGAFGSKSQTTAIQTVNSVQTSGGYMVDFEKQKNSPYTYKKIPYVCRKGLFLTVSKKSLQKCFPDKKEIIEQYIQEKDPNLGNVEEVREMFKTILK
ncbi:MAG: hypothetical protein IKU18_04460 [Bacteroidales bacterium]|nr:hypothetical protein [Bacteroidales bacterium]